MESGVTWDEVVSLRYWISRVEVGYTVIRGEHSLQTVGSSLGPCRY